MHPQIGFHLSAFFPPRPSLPASRHPSLLFKYPRLASFFLPKATLNTPFEPFFFTFFFFSPFLPPQIPSARGPSFFLSLPPFSLYETGVSSPNSRDLVLEATRCSFSLSPCISYFLFLWVLFSFFPPAHFVPRVFFLALRCPFRLEFPPSFPLTSCGFFFFLSFFSWPFFFVLSFPEPSYVYFFSSSLRAFCLWIWFKIFFFSFCVFPYKYFLAYPTLMFT